MKQRKCSQVKNRFNHMDKQKFEIMKLKWPQINKSHMDTKQYH